MTVTNKKELPVVESQATVYCPMCTHSVPATVQTQGRFARIKPGQKCSRCSASLDASKLLWMDRAA